MSSKAIPIDEQPAPPVPAAFYQAEGYRPEESVGYLMRTLMLDVKQAIDRELESACLTNAQWAPLMRMWLGEGNTVAELARGCQLDGGAMTRLLDRMEAKGLCRRIRSQEDRRVVRLELTDEGRAAAEGLPAVLARVQNAYLAGFSQAEFEQLKNFLRRMQANGRAVQANVSDNNHENTPA